MRRPQRAATSSEATTTSLFIDPSGKVDQPLFVGPTGRHPAWKPHHIRRLRSSSSRALIASAIGPEIATTVMPIPIGSLRLTSASSVADTGTPGGDN